MDVDVLCIGHASHDLIVEVDHHLGPDEKTEAKGYLSCGGGPAANAAIGIARLGLTAAFCGYLGRDGFGDQDLAELQAEDVDTSLVVRGDAPTPLASIWVKPDGQRSVVLARDLEVIVGEAVATLCWAIDPETGERMPPSSEQEAIAPFSPRNTEIVPRAILFDGHQPGLSWAWLEWALGLEIPTILDAGSVHQGTKLLTPAVGHLIASERFALDFTREESTKYALEELRHDGVVAITLGDAGVVWADGLRTAKLDALEVDAVDSTGAGDAFHAAYAAGVVWGWPTAERMAFANAAGAASCLKLGARPGMPSRAEVESLLDG